MAPPEVVIIREYDSTKDATAVEQVENRCEVGPSGKLSLHTDLLGDPICRVRHSPAFRMLVAETPDDGIVGMIRGSIKTVTCGTKISRNNPAEPLPVFTKLGYVLGLRVSPSHRRLGIGLKLVTALEDWFRENGAEYSYMATENDNEASVRLFTNKCGYTKFRTPAILVQPVFAHSVKLNNRVTIIKLAPDDAESLYRTHFSTTEFFPRDFDSILKNDLNLGTYLAVPHESRYAAHWPGTAEFLRNPPESWAVLSAWNSKQVFKLEVRGASHVRKALAKTTRLLDRIFPWLGLPSVPKVFEPFGFHLLYGLGGEGPKAGLYMKTLCGLAHNIAKAHKCSVVAAEVAREEPLRLAIPYWKILSCAEDLWCIKRLGEDYSDGAVGDWTKSQPGLSIFVDPRDF